MEKVFAFLKNGSARRFLAFLLTLVLLALSHHLGLEVDALTAIVTLTLGYIGQGTVKEVMKRKSEEELVEASSPPGRIGY